MKIFFIACILSVSILLIGCSGVPSATLRQISVDNLAQGYGWGKERITTPFFDLISYSSETKNSGRLLTIYIEAASAANRYSKLGFIHHEKSKDTEGED